LKLGPPEIEMDSPCPPLSDLRRFLEGSRSEEEDFSIETHLSTCQSCQARLTKLDPIHSQTNSENAKAPPTRTNSLSPHWPTFSDLELIEQIGKGGFGDVFLAYQLSANRRKVAVKIIRHPMTTREVRSRFEREIAALSSLSHVNVAQVFQTTLSDDRIPAIVMEYVGGPTLTELIEQNGLSFSDRVEIAISLCRAVDVIHNAGTLHRDLKPANILFDEKFGKPIPKIVDFGLSSESSWANPFSDQRAGTPSYMSPEQAGHRPEMIGVRSDIYSLGLCIYELISGNRASRGMLGEGTESYLTRRFDPSCRLPELKLTAQVGMRLERRQQTDLHAVLSKSTSLAPSDRYRSAEELAIDLLAIRDRYPISIRRNDQIYRGRLFIRRNSRALAVTSAGIFLVAAAGLTSWKKQGEADRAINQSGAFVQRQIDASNPAVIEHPIEISRDAALEQAIVSSKQARELDAGQSDAYLKVRLSGANSLIAQGESELAIGELESIVADSERRFGEGSDDVLAARMHLGKAYVTSGQLRAGEDQYQLAAKIWKRRYGIHDARTLAAIHGVAQVHFLSRRYKLAFLLQDKIVDHYKPDPSDPDLLIAEVRFARGVSLVKLKRFGQALNDFAIARKLFSKAELWESHPTMLMIRSSVAEARQGLGDCPEAVSILRSVVADGSRIYPKGSPAVERLKFKLAIAQTECDERDEGLEALRQLADDSTSTEVKRAARTILQRERGNE